MGLKLGNKLSLLRNSMQAITKRRLIEYKRDGTERVTYELQNKEGSLKTISPLQWFFVDLEDITPNSIKEKAAKLRYKAAKRNFGRQVDDNRFLRSINPEPGTEYQTLCKHLNIKF